MKLFVDNMVTRYKPNTVRTYYSGLTRFAAWLIHEELIEGSDNPTRNVAIPTEDLDTPAIISDEHLRAMMDSCKGRDFLNRRDTAMLRVLLDTGIRAGEFLGMPVKGTNLDHDTAVVLEGKQGSRDRLQSEDGHRLDRDPWERAKQKMPVSTHCGSLRAERCVRQASVRGSRCWESASDSRVCTPTRSVIAGHTRTCSTGRAPSISSVSLDGRPT